MKRQTLSTEGLVLAFIVPLTSHNVCGGDIYGRCMLHMAHAFCDQNSPLCSNMAAAAFVFAFPTAPNSSAQVMRKGKLVLSAASCRVTSLNCSLTQVAASLQTLSQAAWDMHFQCVVTA